MKQQSKKMSEQEKQQWDELYQYVKKEVFNYDDNQALSRTAVLRLKGLRTSRFMENKNVESMSNYSYEVILNTFKACSISIQKALNSKEFQDDSHKLNYILKIVEPKINSVYKRMKDNELTKQKQEELIDYAMKTHHPNYNHNYENHFQDSPDEINPILVKEFEDLW